ncbi:hypothetical protein MKW92_013300 [Papaver armeniacum]|nr:hypothetical protein MKW92_013300 [Papaver armeniacum]
MENEIHNDDDEILIMNSEGEYEEADVQLTGGKAAANIFNNLEAPLEKCPFNVLVELKGVGAKEGRLGVDLVTVLDISGSMDKGVRLLKMKLAMEFLVKKLSGIDRLSVVTFSRHAHKLCRLRLITETSQTEITDLIIDLEAKSTTNIEAGLRLALKILKDRSCTKNRSVAIMLMSDGIEDDGISNAVSVPVSEVPVYTFAFGSECDDEVLSAIAKNSKGGTFTYVPELNDLSAAFSTSLAGLLNVAIEDLSLTATPLNGTELNKLNAGNYPMEPAATLMEPVPITVKFSSLYNRETRNVLAELTLPEVENRVGMLIFKVELKYRVNGKDEFDSDLRTLNVTRKSTPKSEENPEVLAEETRIRTASSIKEARILADTKKLVEAKQKLVDAGTSLTDIHAILKSQVDHLVTLMASQETYDSKGKAFALALEASHESQRSTVLPDGIPSMYDTPLMVEYKKQAEEFNRNPETYVVPTAEQDEIATAPPTIQVDQVILDLAHRLAQNLKEELESQAPPLQVERSKILDIFALSKTLAETLKEELDLQDPASTHRPHEIMGVLVSDMS